MKQIWLGAAALALIACSQQEAADGDAAPATDSAAPAAEGMTTDDLAGGDVAEGAAVSADARLDEVLAAQSDETKARYQYRHPKETLTFFGVEPGMTVVDILPGEPGWYGPILLDYLGPDGRLIGADYSLEMWPLFGQYAPDMEKRKNWASDYVSAAEAVRGDDDASVSAYAIGSAPDDLDGSVDVVLMNRAAHHFNRLENGRFFTEALAEIMDILKPGGVLGVVQHRAPESASDEWAKGDSGYVKQSQIVSVIEGAGFELVEASEINANPNDQPTEEDIVWRLPPTLISSQDNAELKAQMEAIGESDRMTLKFRKPE